MAHAQQVAEAQIAVVRVRRWRLHLMEQHLSDLVDPDDVPACGVWQALLHQPLELRESKLGPLDHDGGR